MSDQTSTITRTVGKPFTRVEDERLLTGRGNFVDDIQLPNLAHAAFVRSETAHGEIRRVDVTAASEMPGVLAVLTAADLKGEVTPIRAKNSLPDYHPADTPVLAGERVRLVGEPIAIVVAQSRYLAEDAAAAVVVDTDPLPAVTTIEAALDPQAPQLHEEVPGNVWITMSETRGDVDAAFAEATLVFDLEVSMARVTAAPIEPRAIIADLSVRGGRATVHVTSQGPHFLRTGMARCLGIGEQDLRVISPDVGGGFGSKLPLYQEYVAVAAASRIVRRPVKWTADRREEMMTLAHAREQIHRISAAADAEGHLLGMRVDISADAGAYSVWPQTAALEGMNSAQTIPGGYLLENLAKTVIVVATNKSAVAPYRGVGRTVAALTMERTMDEIARRLDLDPLLVRERNVIRDFPHNGPRGSAIAIASFAESIELMRESLDWENLSADLERRRAEFSQAGGKTLARGIGFGLGIESAAPGKGIGNFGADGMIAYETASVVLGPDGRVVVTVGTHSHGQGHETTMAQIAAEVLQIDHAQIAVRNGDTDALSYGGGTWSSRSAVMGGGAVVGACERLIGRARAVAAFLLEAEPEELTYADGTFHGPASEVSLTEVAYQSRLRAHLIPDEIEGGLEVTYRYVPKVQNTVANFLHAALVEVDVETGGLTLLRYVAIEDCGGIINPLIVDGQVHGGIAQGIGNAMFEELAFDANGQPLTTTLLDYLLPTADSIPDLELHRLETLDPGTIHGIKGVAEGAVIPPPAAIMNAVNDALRPLGATLSRTPITPNAIVAAIAAAKSD